jgi:hypothetical protein
VDVVHEIKPRFSRDQIQAAIRELHERGYVVG